MFALAVQISDFTDSRYHVPAYPFLFFFVAHALAYCQDRFPRVQRKIQTAFLASVVVLGLATHTPLLSLERPGITLSAKGYAYAYLPWLYLDTHAPPGPRDREFILEMVQRPFLSDTLPCFLSKLSSDDLGDLARAITVLLGKAVPFNGQAEDFARIERLVPPRVRQIFLLSGGSGGHRPASQRAAQGGRRGGIFTSPIGRGASPGLGRHLPAVAAGCCPGQDP